MNRFANIYNAWLRKSRLGWSEFPCLFAFLVFDVIISNAIRLEHVFNIYLNWILFSIQYLFLIIAYIAWKKKKYVLLRKISFIVSILVIAKEFFVSASLATKLLIHPDDISQNDASSLFGDAVILWFMNILLFSAFYWLIDGGGSIKRNSIRSYMFMDTFNPYVLINSNGEIQGSDFLFPLQERKDIFGWYYWTPGIVDYLFLAFSTSTAFSPTDTLILTPRSKVFTVIQAIISLLSITILAARAINILKLPQQAPTTLYFLLRNLYG